MKTACIADSQNEKGYFKECGEAERENNRKRLTSAPRFQDAVYKYVEIMCECRCDFAHVHPPVWVE